MNQEKTKATSDTLYCRCRKFSVPAYGGAESVFPAGHNEDGPCGTVATLADPRLSQPGTVEYYQALLEQRDAEIERLRADADRLEAAVGGLVRDKTRLESANAKLREELADVTQRLMEKTGWA